VRGTGRGSYPPNHCANSPPTTPPKAEAIPAISISFFSHAEIRERIKEARSKLALQDGEYLQQDNAEEAARILGRVK